MSEESSWKPIGTVVGNASHAEFTFILKSFKSRVGDLVTVRMEVPDDEYSGTRVIYVWGRVLGINRFNPFFPYEAAQELSDEGIALRDTILSDSRDQLQAEVLILGCTQEESFKNLYPLTYPVQPAAEVYYPPAEAVRELLAGGIPGHTPTRIGTLMARSDVNVSISADRVISRHMAILAMTGGGKTVAARRILRELINIGYPVLILDPHGDYLGIWEHRQKFENTEVHLFYPHIAMTEENRAIIEVLISKMTVGLTEPQKEKLGQLLVSTDPKPGETVLNYIEKLQKKVMTVVADQNRKREHPTYFVLRRSLGMVADRLRRMEATNQRMRAMLKGLEFEQLPDPKGRPEGIVRPQQVSILYLGGYDHLTQTTIASVLLESLFEHRANLSNIIPPFLALIEEAHTFIPSAREGTTDAPSLETIRKMITEGRKFGTGLLLVSQRPSRVDETILAQCNSFLILRLVNPRDQTYVRQVMENLSEADAKMLPGFGPGQGIVSGQAVRFPLPVKIAMDTDLLHSALGDEDFIKQAAAWAPDKNAESRAQAALATKRLAEVPARRPGTRAGDGDGEATMIPPSHPSALESSARYAKGQELTIRRGNRTVRAVVYDVESNGAIWLELPDDEEGLIGIDSPAALQEMEVEDEEHDNGDETNRAEDIVEEWGEYWQSVKGPPDKLEAAADLYRRLNDRFHFEGTFVRNGLRRIIKSSNRPTWARRVIEWLKENTEL